MNHRLLGRLGSRLFLSYALASLAAAVSGMAAAFFVPPQTYHDLMLKVMYPPPGATLEQMDATLAAAIARVVVLHVTLSLAVAIGVSILVAAYLSRQISGAIRRVTHATRRLADGDFTRRLPPEDIQEISELVRDVNTLAKSLEEAERRRSLAIASVGHELRTPVTALRAYCDAVRDGVIDLTPDVMERMSHSVQRLERMASDLSALAGAEAGTYQDITLVPLTTADVLRSAFDAVYLVFDSAGVELCLEDAGADERKVCADAVRLAEVLENFLSNSLAHTPKGKRVFLGVHAHASEIEFFVRDEGRGIDPQDLPHLVEPFYRGEGGSAGRTPRAGMGLGLTIANRLVQAMGGRIALKSPGKGMGTTASVYLPAIFTDS